MSLVTDKNDPRLHNIQDNGQQEVYVVLSEEERAKGFIRPVRNSYIHIGRKLTYKNIHRELDEEEKKEHNHKYVAVMTQLTKEDGSFAGGPYVTQQELDAWKAGVRFGGCNTSTRMGRELSETYARDPKFYGGTFCCHCRTHLPVTEFIWEGTNEQVGS